MSNFVLVMFTLIADDSLHYRLWQDGLGVEDGWGLNANWTSEKAKYTLLYRVSRLLFGLIDPDRAEIWNSETEPGDLGN
jgi:hypothetical protein